MRKLTTGQPIPYLEAAAAAEEEPRAVEAIGREEHHANGVQNYSGSHGDYIATCVAECEVSGFHIPSVINIRSCV